MDEMRLVDANAIKYREKDEYCGNGNSRPVRYVFDEDIAELPTVDAEKVVHGKWVWKDLNGDGSLALCCSVCLGTDGARETAHYCSECGAKMDGGAKDGT